VTEKLQKKSPASMRQYTTEDRETIYGWWKAEQKDWVGLKNKDDQRKRHLSAYLLFKHQHKCQVISYHI